MSKTVRKFYLQIESCSEHTHWLYDDWKVKNTLHDAVENICRQYTKGTIPRVTLTPEEQPEPVRVHRHD